MNKISLERLTGFDSYDYLPSIGFHQGLFQTDTINLKNSEFGSKGTNACPVSTVSNLSRIDFYKIDHLVGAKLFWGSYRL